MQRLDSVNPQVATGRTKELFDTVQQAFGMIPNTARVMANSPAVLDSFLANFLNNLADTDLDIPKVEPVEACATSTCGTEACSAH